MLWVQRERAMATDQRGQATTEVPNQVGHLRTGAERPVRVQGVLTGPAVAGGIVELVINRRVEAQ
jgi:hypothetical protein